uniref:TIDP3438 n=2 Tax=Arundo donax TaxID=35708 RepID=A0A0A9E3Y9_ARUDO
MSCTSEDGDQVLNMYMQSIKHIHVISPSSLASVDPSAVFTDFSSGGVCQRLNVPHVDHGLCKILEEGILAARKLVDDRCCDALRLGG